MVFYHSYRKMKKVSATGVLLKGACHRDKLHGRLISRVNWTVVK